MTDNLGPESLRALINQVSNEGMELRREFDAHAAAWEVRERRIALLEGDLRTAKANWDAACDDAAKLEADNAALRERLEAEVKLQIEFRKGLLEQNGLVLTLNRKLEAAKRILISEGWDAYKLDDAIDARAWPYGSPSEVKP